MLSKGQRVRLMLISLSMCPNRGLHMGRWIYYGAKKLFSHLKKLNNGKDNENDGIRS